MNHIHFFSDGAESLFENKFTAQNLVHHQDEFGCSAGWSYFETGHGKGPVNGMGGTVKRKVLLDVYDGHSTIHNASSFAYEAKRLFPQSITILYVPSSTLKYIERWGSAQTGPKIRMSHFLEVSEGKVKLQMWSPFTSKAGQQEAEEDQLSNNVVGFALYMTFSHSMICAQPTIGILSHTRLIT